MNVAPFWRLVWKEYRIQRPLWIAMMALIGFVLLVVHLTVFDRAAQIDLLYNVGLALPILYALGCGAVLFAGEHEAGTYAFQRALPVTASRVFLAKVLYAGASTLMLFAATGLLAGYLSDWTLPRTGLIDYPVNLYAAVIMLLLSIVTLMWATLLSLIVRRVLVAAILAIAAASLSIEIGGDALFSLHARVTNPTTIWLVLCFSIAAPLAFVDFMLGRRWFREQRDRKALPLRKAKATPSQATVAAKRFTSPDRLATLRRLVWQHRRQSLSTMLAIVTVIIVLALFPSGILVVHISNLSTSVEFDQKPLYLLALAAAPLIGVCTFLADQRGRSYRFLSDRGVPPKYIWRSRQLLALVPCVAVLPVVLGAAYFLAPSEYVWMHPDAGEMVFHTTRAMLFVLTYVVTALAVGQLCSMFVRSAILAGVFGVMSATVLGAWCELMWFWHVPKWWSLAPIPLALLLATRLRTAGWLLERNSLRSWLGPSLAVILAFAAILVAVPAYRVYEIPDVAPGFSFDAYAGPPSAEEQRAMDIYYKAVTEMDRHGEVSEDETVARAIETTRATLVHPVDSTPIQGRIRLLPFQFAFGATQLAKAGKLDAAIQRYMAGLRLIAQLRKVDLSFVAYTRDPAAFELDTFEKIAAWAGSKGQTPKRIAAAQRELEKLASANHIEAPAFGLVKLEYLRLRAILEGNVNALAESGKYPPSTLLTAWFQLPWERQRALRRLNLETLGHLGGAWHPLSFYGRSEKVWQVQKLIPFSGAPRSGELLDALRNHLQLPALCDRWGSDISWQNYLAVETARRATQIVLALEAWKLRNGSLPTSLDELVGHELSRLPDDPYSGEPFCYFPTGLNIPLNRKRSDQSQKKLLQTLPANTPFLWSTGLRVNRSGHRDLRAIVDEWRVRDYDSPNSHPWENRYSWNIWRKPLLEYDVWEAGWPFAIP